MSRMGKSVETEGKLVAARRHEGVGQSEAGEDRGRGPAMAARSEQGSLRLAKIILLRFENRLEDPLGAQVAEVQGGRQVSR